MDMRRRRLVDRVVGAFITSVITVLMLGFAVLWVTYEPDSAGDPNTITIEYDCREVFASPDGFPDQVISECMNLPKFIKKPTPTVT